MKRKIGDLELDLVNGECFTGIFEEEEVSGEEMDLASVSVSLTPAGGW